MRIEEESAEALGARKRGKPGGAKGRRTTKQTIPTTFMNSPGVFRNDRTRPQRAAHRAGGGADCRWIPAGGDTAGGERDHERMRKQAGAE